jgi:hypothetical protein
MTNAQQAKLAETVRRIYADSPDLTVDEVVDQIGDDEIGHNEVVEILDQYLVQNGTVKHVGPGGGGGWRADS